MKTKIFLLFGIPLILSGCGSDELATNDPDFLHAAPKVMTKEAESSPEKAEDIPIVSDEKAEDLAEKIPGGSPLEKTTILRKPITSSAETEKEQEEIDESFLETTLKKSKTPEEKTDSEDLKIEDAVSLDLSKPEIEESEKEEKEENSESSEKETPENTEIDERYSALLVREAQKYEEKGEEEKALAFLERALSEDPENEFAKKKHSEISEKIKNTESQKCASRDFFADNFFEGILLKNRIPEKVFTHEILTLRGKIIEKKSDRVTAFVRSEKGEESFVAFAEEDGSFEIPIFFPSDAKNAEILLILGTSGNSKTAQVSIENACFDSSGETEEKASPKNLTGASKNGRAFFSWEAEEMSFFRLVFSQGEKSQTFFVIKDQSSAPDPSFFRDFEKGSVSLRVAGKSSVSDPWSSEAVFNFSAGVGISRDRNHISVKVPEYFEKGKEIQISGIASQKLDLEMIVASPSEVFSRVPLAVSGSSFSAVFVPEELGSSYEIEINQDDQIALFVAHISPKGEIPLLPDFFGKREKREFLEPELRAESLLQLVNTERVARRGKGLKVDEQLSELAQFRADDMCQQNYFGHQDPLGKYARDYRGQFEIQRGIGENIAKDTSIAGAHAGLMNSLGHRELILSPDFSEIGFGFCETQGQIIVVQIFGKEPILAEAVSLAQNQIWKNIRNTRREDISEMSIVKIFPETEENLEKIAREIAQQMSKEGTIETTKDKELNEKIKKANPEKSVLVLRMMVSRLDDLLEAVKNETIEIEGQSFDNFLLDKSIRQGGIGIATNGEKISLVFLGK